MTNKLRPYQKAKVKEMRNAAKHGRISIDFSPGTGKSLILEQFKKENNTMTAKLTHDQILGQTLREMRQRQGISQDKLAKAVGITFQQVQKYEKGINRMAASRILQICEVLGIPSSAFFMQIEKDVKFEPRDKREMKLLHEFGKLNEPQKGFLVTLMTFLKS